jgi:nicotinate-nucleotide adenylyltransferase
MPTSGDVTATDGSALRRVGVFGGTFDPPHNAHLVAASAAREALGLDRVLLMVAGDPWQKTALSGVTAADHRLAMTQLLVDGNDGLVVSDLEVRRSGPSFTVDTLAELAAADVRLVLILGSDAAAGISTWERPEEVLELADIAVVERPGLESVSQLGSDLWSMAPDGHRVERVIIPRLDISSSDLRRRLRGGLTVCGLVPPAVSSYAAHHGIYREHS